MIAGNALLWGIRKLKPLEKTSHGDLAAFDVEILLAFVLKKPKEFLYAHPEKKLTAAQLAHFKKLITRRAKHEPIAYITNQKEFFGLNFYVDKNVLIPRPETETLVEATISNIKYPISNSQTIVDIGAGSGCVAVSLAKRFPNAKIFATEISSGAMKVARKNARHHKAAVIFLRGNLLMPFLKNLKSETCLPARQVLNLKSLTIVANLPYLTTAQWRRTQPEIKGFHPVLPAPLGKKRKRFFLSLSSAIKKYEPRLALDGGSDGLKFYRELLNQLKKLKIISSKLKIACFFEIDPAQTKSITKLIYFHFPKAQIQIKKDLAKQDRVVMLKIKN